MYRRVEFIHGPWYDDHFDKTLTNMVTHSNDLLSRCSLLYWLDSVREDGSGHSTEWNHDSSLSSLINASMVCTVYSVSFLVHCLHLHKGKVKVVPYME